MRANPSRDGWSLGPVDPSKPGPAGIKALTDLYGQNAYQCEDNPENNPQHCRIGRQVIVNELRRIPACCHRNDNENDDTCPRGAIGNFSMTASTN